MVRIRVELKRSNNDPLLIYGYYAWVEADEAAEIPQGPVLVWLKRRGTNKPLWVFWLDGYGIPRDFDTIPGCSLRENEPGEIIWDYRLPGETVQQ